MNAIGKCCKTIWGSREGVMKCCLKCGKTKYGHVDAARDASRGLKKRHPAKSFRPYWASRCDCWHVTSLPLGVVGRAG